MVHAEAGCQPWGRLGLWVCRGSTEPWGDAKGHHPKPEVGSQGSILTVRLPKHTAPDPS